MKRQYLGFGVIAVFALVWSVGAAAAQNTNAAGAQEISTAQAHALMASNEDSLKTAHAHLQHAINCLVGPDGKAFDPKVLNPCNGMGNGALSDVTDNGKLHATLLKAVAAAEFGLKADKLSMAQKAAKEAAQLLGKAARS